MMIRYNPRPIYYNILVNESHPTLELTIRVPGFYSIKCIAQHAGKLYEKYANVPISGTVSSIGYCMYVCVYIYIYIYIYIYYKYEYKSEYKYEYENFTTSINR